MKTYARFQKKTIVCRESVGVVKPVSKKAGSLNIWDVLVQHFMPTTEDIANWEMLAIYGLHLVSPQVPHGVWVSGTNMYMILTNTFLAMYAASEMLNSACFTIK